VDGQLPRGERLAALAHHLAATAAATARAR
jgi:hypothetical protein